MQIRNPLTVIQVTGGQDEPGGESRITDYNRNTGTITGYGFGSTAGTVYMLDRATHTYVAQPTSSWSNNKIKLTTPLDLVNLEGDTSIVAVDANGKWSTKYLVEGDIAVPGYAKVYVRDSDTRAIRVIAVDNNTDFGKLVGSDNGWSKAVTIGSDTFYLDEVVGVQIGSQYANSATTGYLFAYMPSLNQPLKFPSSLTSIGAHLLEQSASFNQPLVLPSTIASIDTNFLRGCTSFNQPIDVSHATSIGRAFLYECFSFNQPLSFSNDFTTVGIEFMTYCQSYNRPLNLSQVTSINNTFLAYCSSFNSPLDISGATAIGQDFLRDCFSFNQPLRFSSSFTTINNSFLYDAYSFNQPLDLSHVTTIGQSFLYHARSFNSPVTLGANLTSLDTGFMRECSAFNQPLTIPASVTTISGHFLQDLYAFSNLTVETTTLPASDTSSLSSQYNSTKNYTKGITLTGTGASTWTAGIANRTSKPFRNLILGGA